MLTWDIRFKILLISHSWLDLCSSGINAGWRLLPASCSAGLDCIDRAEHHSWAPSTLPDSASLNSKQPTGIPRSHERQVRSSRFFSDSTSVAGGQPWGTSFDVPLQCYEVLKNQFQNQRGSHFWSEASGPEPEPGSGPEVEMSRATSRAGPLYFYFYHIHALLSALHFSYILYFSSLHFPPLTLFSLFSPS